MSVTPLYHALRNSDQPPANVRSLIPAARRDPYRGVAPATLAAINCGTNSTRLLIADASGGQLTDVLGEIRIVRIGQRVDAPGELAPEALQRTRPR